MINNMTLLMLLKIGSTLSIVGGFLLFPMLPEKIMKVGFVLAVFGGAMLAVFITGRIWEN